MLDQQAARTSGITLIKDDGTSPAEQMAELRNRLNVKAEHHGDWLRQNVRLAMEVRGVDAQMIQAMTGVSAGTVKAFLSGVDSGVKNVMLIGLALGVDPPSLCLDPKTFRQAIQRKR